MFWHVYIRLYFQSFDELYEFSLNKSIMKLNKDDSYKWMKSE